MAYVAIHQRLARFHLALQNIRNIISLEQQEI
jgi:hypothetical protein